MRFVELAEMWNSFIILMRVWNCFLNFVFFAQCNYTRDVLGHRDVNYMRTCARATIPELTITSVWRICKFSLFIRAFMISLYLFKLLFDFIHPQRIREKGILWNLPSGGNCIYRPDYKASSKQNIICLNPACRIYQLEIINMLLWITLLLFAFQL